MKILVIDNYDSFTFNLVQLVGKFTSDIIVKRNDEISLEEIEQMNPDKILISPGPGRPEDSKISLEVIKEVGKTKPVLGVCLGHQGIGICYGAEITNAPVLMHGKTSQVIHDEKTVFKDIPQYFYAGRYHSLIIDRDSLNGELEVTSETADGIVMGVRHKKYPIEGIQFHPESILTPQGVNIIKNWIDQ
jgi:anthranilate synthase/aminodeoxychorismate synthase-like glutamine amidotransferase